MFTNKLNSLFLASLFTLGALGATATTAEASSVRSYRSAFQTAHAQATRSTASATAMANEYNMRSQQFDNAMRSSNASYRAQAKRYAIQWLTEFKRRLDRAASDHLRAIYALDAYLRRVGGNPSAQQLRNQLTYTLNQIRTHSQNIGNTMIRVSRMR